MRTDLLTTAADLLAATGDESGLSIREVAGRVGVSPPSVYLHFADKATLVQAVLEAQFALLVESVDRAISGVADPAQVLREGCLAYLEFAEQRPGTYRMLFGGAPSANGAGTLSTMPGREAFDQLVTGVRKYHESLDVPADKNDRRSRDAERDATLLWIGLHGIASLRQARSDFPWPDTDVLLDELLERLIGNPA